MAGYVIKSPNQITADWLTDLLTRSGALESGRVASFETISNDGILSTSTRIRIVYSREATGPLPERLFLKTVNADQDEEFFGASEVNYYLGDYKGVDCAPIPRCYDAAYSETERRYHLLIDDLSSTHIEAKHKPTTLEYGRSLAEALACLHAPRWGASGVAQVAERIPNAQQIERFIAVARPGAAHIISSFADQLQAHWPALIEEILERHPPVMIARAADDNGFALLHGDPNWNNILVPREGQRPIYLIDRQPFDWSLTVWLAVYDLAYVLVLDWPIADRRQHEMDILRHYHAALGELGIEGYSWAQLLDDYRLSVVMCVYVSIEWCRGGINEQWIHVWLPMLQQSLTACDDLNSQSLWT